MKTSNTLGAVILLIVFFQVNPVMGQQAIVDQFEKRSQTFQGVTLPYRLFVPADYDSTRAYPLILALHGAGERGTDNEVHIRVHRLATSWADPDNQANYPAFVVAPQVPPGGRWTADQPVDQSSFNGFELTTLDILDSLAVAFNIDEDRVYVTGLSMGGHGAWDMVTRLPNRFAAAVPMSGNADPSQADKLLHVPIWVFHGENDTVVPATSARGIVFNMENLGKDVLYTDCRRSLPAVKNFDCPGTISNEDLAQAINYHADLIYTGTRGGGHGPWAVWYDHPLLNDWLFSQYRINPLALTWVSPAAGDVLSGEQEVSWTFTGTASDSVEIWLTLDNGTTWSEIDRRVNENGTYTLDTGQFVDASFAQLRLFVKNDAGFVYGRQTSPAFVIDNAEDAPPFLSIDDEDLRFNEEIGQAMLSLPVLASDPEKKDLETQIFYSIDDGITYTKVQDSLLVSSAEVQTLRIHLASLPNSAQARIKVEISDGVHVVEDVTTSFEKRTARIVNDYFVHVAGEGVGRLEMHFVEPEQLTGHRYQVTFSDASGSSDGIKSYSVTDLDEARIILEDIPLSDGVTESPLFDGIRLIVQDLEEGAPDLEATGWTVGSSTLGITISGGSVILALKSTDLLETEDSYELVFSNTVVDTSQALFALPAQEMQFLVRGQEDGLQRAVLYKDIVGDGRPSSQDLLYILEEDELGELAPAWEIRFSSTSATAFPELGDVFLFTPLRKLSAADVFEFVAAEGVSTEQHSKIDEPGIQSIFPNPFDEEVHIVFRLDKPGQATVSIFDLLGREVAKLASETLNAGEHRLNWQPGLSNARPALASGMYMARLTILSPRGNVIYHQSRPIVRIR